MITAVGAADRASCWCCGASAPEQDLLQLSSRPEAAVCLRCAEFLARRARERRDAQRPGPGARARDVLRSGRAAVMKRGWHRRPVIGAALRRLGRHLP